MLSNLSRFAVRRSSMLMTSVRSFAAGMCGLSGVLCLAAEGNMVNIKINGTEYQVAEGMTVLEACQAKGIHVPFVCHHPRLAPLGRLYLP